VRIGFDLDGVIVHQNGAEWRYLENEGKALRDYVAALRPTLDIKMFVHPGDEAFIVTGRDSRLHVITDFWCQKWFPGIVLHCVNQAIEEPVGGWIKHITSEKAKVIRVLELDVYFEDNATVVERLRILCPNTKIIQYGGMLGRWTE